MRDPSALALHRVTILRVLVPLYPLAFASSDVVQVSIKLKQTNASTGNDATIELNAAERVDLTCKCFSLARFSPAIVVGNGHTADYASRNSGNSTSLWITLGSCAAWAEWSWWPLQTPPQPFNPKRRE